MAGSCPSSIAAANETPMFLPSVGFYGVHTETTVYSLDIHQSMERLSSGSYGKSRESPQKCSKKHAAN